MAERPTDERAPLLDREARAEAGEDLTFSSRRARKWTLAWYTVFTILGVLVVAVFDKGIVDSDDVEILGRLQCREPRHVVMVVRVSGPYPPALSVAPSVLPPLLAQKIVFTATLLQFDLGKALKSALGGAVAMILQVLTHMPLRTVMNFIKFCA
ncbi:hypothetical protein BD311DRAFT_797734, partial [Dichomitus squalens]